FIVPDAPEALAKLAQAGVPSFRTPECCADAIAAAFRRRTSRAPQAAPKQFRKTAASQLNEWDAYALFEKIELPFGYPVAVKVLSEVIAHKTDVGGVILNIASEPALKAAIGQIVRSVKDKRPDVEVNHVLVQPMTSGLGEVLLGYKKDADAGPIVLLAAGGIFTEIYRDRSIRLAPVELQTAREMISELAITRAFEGYRGKKAGDLDSLAHAVVALSQLALSDEYDVVDAEINPLILRSKGEGVLALDALVKLS
ncbi:MAG: acetate--CoA ligase family protein, partial [Afipia sp.]|nr:acetate--CoA ligase family protein [Afipia sp.]